MRDILLEVGARLFGAPRWRPTASVLALSPPTWLGDDGRVVRGDCDACSNTEHGGVCAGHRTRGCVEAELATLSAAAGQTPASHRASALRRWLIAGGDAGAEGVALGMALEAPLPGTDPEEAAAFRELDATVARATGLRGLHRHQVAAVASAWGGEGA